MESNARLTSKQLVREALASRAVAASLKVVRRRKSSSADGTRGGEHERGALVRGGRGGRGYPPRKF